MTTATRRDEHFEPGVIWQPGTEHWSSGDGKYWAIHQDTPELDALMQTLIGAPLTAPEKHNVIPQPTEVIETDENGVPVPGVDDEGLATDMMPDAVFPAGTSAEDALRQMGYEIGA